MHINTLAKQKATEGETKVDIVDQLITAEEGYAREEAIGTDEHEVDSYFTTSPAFSFGQISDTETQAQYKVTIVIWIEGQDPDCTNAVASLSITANFVFGFTAPTNNG